MPPVQTTIRCSNCGQPVPAQVRSLIDAAQDPEGKAMLVTGRLNQAPCPACSAMNVIATPVLYHDAKKELLIAFVPSQLALRSGSEEKMVGDLLNELTKSLPKGSFKGYMLNPKRSLTLQGLIDQVLQADGITPEVMEAQRKRVELAQKFIEAHPDNLPTLAREHDAEINRELLQTMTAMAQRILQSGNQDVAEHIILVQNVIAQHSSYGQELIKQRQEQEQIVAAMAEELEQLGDAAQRADFITLVDKYKEDEMRLEALVGLARPVFDYQFFQELTVYIGQAPTDQREKLEIAREHLVRITQMMDQEMQRTMQRSAQLLQAIVNHPNPDEVIQANIQMIDDMFMQVLAMNIQETERRGDTNISARLRDISNRVVTALQSQMQPELLFVNQLLSVNSEAEAHILINQHAHEFGPVLLEVIDAVRDVLQSQGRQDMIPRLEFIRQEMMSVFNG